nr:NADH dehydrogenase subunit 5, mitochondrial [Tanacetum cinerariifolium]
MAPRIWVAKGRLYPDDGALWGRAQPNRDSIPPTSSAPLYRLNHSKGLISGTGEPRELVRCVGQRARCTLLFLIQPFLSFGSESPTKKWVGPHALFETTKADKAAIKAMLVNRVGDFGLAPGILGCFTLFQTVDFSTIFACASVPRNSWISRNMRLNAITLICILLLIGAGKSAQIGSHTWSPDAIEGPTPVSALIYAATMVTAGVFMIARCSPLFEYPPTTLIVITFAGAMMSFLAATTEILQNDLKRAIAYSTYSQLGYMIFACGISNYSSNDVTRLQALVDKKKVVVSEAAIRDALHLDDAEGSMSAKRTSWNEFSSAMASVVICLSTGRKFNFSKYIFNSLVRNVDSSLKFYMYPRFIHLIIQNQLGDLSTHTTKYISPALTQKVFANMKRVRKGCSGVETPLFEGMLVAREPKEQGDAKEQGTADNAAEEPVTAVSEDDEALDTCVVLTRRVEHLEHDRVAQNLEITKLKTRVKKLERANKGRMIDELDKDEGAVLMNENEETEEVKVITGDAQVGGRQAEIYQIDMDYAAKVLSMQEDESEVHEAVESMQEDELEVHEAVEVVTTAKLIIEVVVVVSETVSPAAVVPTVIVAVVPTVTADPVKTEAQARRSMMMYLKNTVGFRLDYFKGMSYDNRRPIFEAKFNSNIKFLLKSKEQIEEKDNRAIASINETLAQKAAKMRRLNKEAEDVKELKEHLEIVPNEDDDVYLEATPLARKNFDREDLESLWSIVKERFSTSKPNNFSDDFLLTTLRAMFERPDGQDQLIMHVERRYPLSTFTLDQMLNVVRLRVEEQSEMSLKLIRFARQQLQEGQHN